MSGIVTHGQTCLQEYDMNTVAQKLELPGAFILGAAAGPSGVLGMNSEVSHPLSCRAVLPVYMLSLDCIFKI